MSEALILAEPAEHEIVVVDPSLAADSLTITVTEESK